MSEDEIRAHRHSAQHRAEVEASAACGCFYCCATFPPAAIAEWTDNGQTALCPLCGVDAVIGDASGYAVNGELLSRMNRHWF